MERLDELSSFTDEPGRMTRLYLTPSHRAACMRLVDWMRAASSSRGSTPRAMCAPAMRGARRRAPALMIGSHIDTVRDAGRYDGNLGALAALSVVEEFLSEASGLTLRSRSSPSAMRKG